MLVSRHLYRTSLVSRSSSKPIFFVHSKNEQRLCILSRLTLGSKGHNIRGDDLPTLRDLDQPFTFNIRLYNREYKFAFYDTASPTNYTLLHPDVIILCYAIPEPDSLDNVQQHWKRIVETHFNYDELIPVILLGLMRDVRQEEDYDGRVRTAVENGEGEQELLNARRIVYPQQALRVAQEMRCDRYCECSALTGEVSLRFYQMQRLKHY